MSKRVKMFRRLWSGLPKDPAFTSDLKELGYYVNDQDEIRLIANPKYYFKFFFNRNERHNERQRFHFNEAVVRLIHERLEAEGLQKIRLPIGAKAGEPNVPIFVSKGVVSKSRVVVIFGQSDQELGVLAHRIIGGKGGINKGSMVSVVQAIKEQTSSKSDAAPPGIILANMGELWWWPEGKRAINDRAHLSVPMQSSVHKGRFYDPKANGVAENGTPEQHVKYIVEKILPKLVNSKAMVDIVMLGDAHYFVASYLDGATVGEGPCIHCLSIVAGSYNKNWLKSESFQKFLLKRTRAWAISSEPLDRPLSGPEGNPQTSMFTDLGCPIYSSGEPYLIETAFIQCYKSVLQFIQEVALDPHYCHPKVTVTFADLQQPALSWADELDEDQEATEKRMQADLQQPAISWADELDEDQEAMEKKMQADFDEWMKKTKKAAKQKKDGKAKDESDSDATVVPEEPVQVA